MASLFRFRVIGLRRLQERVKNKRQLPAVLSDAMREWGVLAVRELKATARMRGITPSTGELFGNGIRWEQRPKGLNARILMRQYGIYLDRMAPHYVSIRRSRSRLLAWALRARSPSIRRKAELVQAGRLPSASIRVVPHPFILQGLVRADAKRPAVLRGHLRRLTA